MKKIISLMSVISMTIFLNGCHKTELIHDVDHHPMPSHVEKMTNEDIKNIITQTVAKRGWICHTAGYNKLVCHCKRRAHQATIEIEYNKYNFSIKHVDTLNLKSKDGKIHPKYNKWVKLLEREIEQALFEVGAPIR